MSDEEDDVVDRALDIVKSIEDLEKRRAKHESLKSILKLWKNPNKENTTSKVFKLYYETKKSGLYVDEEDIQEPVASNELEIRSKNHSPHKVNGSVGFSMGSYPNRGKEPVASAISLVSQRTLSSEEEYVTQLNGNKNEHADDEAPEIKEEVLNVEVHEKEREEDSIFEDQIISKDTYETYPEKTAKDMATATSLYGKRDATKPLSNEKLLPEVYSRESEYPTSFGSHYKPSMIKRHHVVEKRSNVSIHSTHTTSKDNIPSVERRKEGARAKVIHVGGKREKENTPRNRGGVPPNLSSKMSKTPASFGDEDLSSDYYAPLPAPQVITNHTRLQGTSRGTPFGKSFIAEREHVFPDQTIFNCNRMMFSNGPNCSSVGSAEDMTTSRCSTNRPPLQDFASFYQNYISSPCVYKAMKELRQMFSIPNAAKESCRASCSFGSFYKKPASCASAAPPAIDEDEKFIMLVLPYIKELPGDTKLKLRVDFQSLIYDKLYKPPVPLDPIRHQLSTKYKPSKPVIVQDYDEQFYWGLIRYFKELDNQRKLLLRYLFLNQLYRTIYEKKNSPKESDDFGEQNGLEGLKADFDKLKGMLKDHPGEKEDNGKKLTTNYSAVSINILKNTTEEEEKRA